MSIIVIGIDLAKHIFAIRGVNENGRAELVKPLDWADTGSTQQRRQGAPRAHHQGLRQLLRSLLVMVNLMALLAVTI